MFPRPASSTWETRDVPSSITRPDDVGPLFDQRGLPPNPSPEVASDFAQIRGHHESWISVDEAQLVREIDPSFDALHDYLAVVNHLEEGELHSFETRIIDFDDG